MKRLLPFVIAIFFFTNGYAQEEYDEPEVSGYSGDADPHSGHTDPSGFLGQKDKNVTNLQFFS